jgi:RND family efflux transporter MFP subunit
VISRPLFRGVGGIALCLAMASPAFAQTAAEFASKAVVNCTLKPIQTIELNSQISGVVRTVFVRPGQRVELGTPILELDTDLANVELEIARERAQLTAPLETAKVRVSALEIRLGRVQKAFLRKVASALEFEQARMDYRLAASEITQQKQQLDLQNSLAKRAELVVEKSTILSPAHGVIGEDIARPGEQVGTAGIVGTLFVIDQLRAEAFVPLQLLPKIREMTQMKLRIDGNDDTLIDAELDYISPVANLASNTISVYFIVDDPTVLSGSRCELKVPKS